MADLLLAGGKIHTMDLSHPHANAIAFAHERVVAWDDDARALRGPHTTVIDLQGRTVIPGLVDSHIHFTGYAMGVGRVQLDGARSLEEAVSRVAERVQAAEPGELILGMGWNHQDWKDPQFPTKEPLDRVAPHHAVVLDRKDGHSVWLNSAALKLANITRDTPDPAGGKIERDAAGEPAGLLREKAMDLLKGPIGDVADRVTEKQLLEGIRNAHRLGLTGIHNIEGANALRAFENLHFKGRLTLRVLHMIPAENLEHAIALGLQTGLGDDRLRVGGVKIFADGSLGSQTAHLLQPFEGSSDNCGAEGPALSSGDEDPALSSGAEGPALSSGTEVTPPEEIERLARAAAASGLMVVTHAIGDRAIRDVLDVYQKLRRDGFKTLFRIEHVQHLDPADLPRFHELGVIASMQPIHATSDYRMADRLVGKRARYAYAFKSLLNAGAQLIFGSDCPVETLDPLAGIHAAVTRERANGEPPGGWYPEEKLSVEEAVRAYTSPLLAALPASPSARAGQEKATEAGSPADCVVLSEDIFSIPPREILATRVDYTIVAGKVVHAA